MKKAYTVQFAYMSETGENFGTIPSRRMSLDEIDFMFKTVSVGKCREWISSVRSLRRGGFSRIGAVEMTEGGIRMMKGWKISRN